MEQGSRWSRRFRSQITRDLVVEFSSADGVAHHYVFVVEGRSVSSRRGAAGGGGGRGAGGGGVAGHPAERGEVGWGARPPPPASMTGREAGCGSSGTRPPPRTTGRVGVSLPRGGTAPAPRRCAASAASI